MVNGLVTMTELGLIALLALLAARVITLSRMESFVPAGVAGARDGLTLQGQHRQIIGQTPAGLARLQPSGQRRMLRADAGRVGALVPVVVGARGGAETLVFLKAFFCFLFLADQCRLE